MGCHAQQLYPGLKTFIHEAYKRRLTTISLHNTAGSLGYVGNNANAFAGISSTTGEDTNDDDATTVTQAAAAATTGSTLGNTHTTTGTSASFPAEVSAAIQQLAANQTAIMQQFTAFTVNNQPPPTRSNVQVPPVTNINVPQQQSNSTEGFNNIQGASNRDMEDVKEDGVATAAAEAEGEEGAPTIHTHTHLEAFPNMSPRWEDPSKILYPVSTTVALSRLSWGDRQPAEAAAKT